MGLLYTDKNGSQGYYVHINKKADLANSCKSELYFDIQAVNTWDWEEKAMVEIFCTHYQCPHVDLKKALASSF